ncbi:PTS lactose/cellobiose transporter subunit IIA [Breznakia pachnodae]|uniref:PTS system cellobiose-specific IIA component n=1 Tax=Breznakia pachnodae TaxID=265178 RepID=A0ABU0E0D4_9FIRM|nr:PTS lactose/cellobiose transporter subunit IIA [Breznakia pachnodae]MDQ0360347.1 PTS system cellobiose-specific IIA component [Breznakia pachnodae]
MEGIELISFEIISNVGNARSLFIEAIQKAKIGLFEEAEKVMYEGEKSFLEGHHAHASLVQQEANGGELKVTLLLAHAEDQLMSAESFKILSREFIELYKKIL